MDRRAFLAGLIGTLAATTLASAEAATPRTIAPQLPSDPIEAADVGQVGDPNLDEMQPEYAQYYRRRGRQVYRRYVRRPYRRYRRRARRYWRRGRWYYY